MKQQQSQPLTKSVAFINNSKARQTMCWFLLGSIILAISLLIPASSTSAAPTGGKFTMTDGSTLMFTGQNIEDVNDTTQNVYENLANDIQPVGVTAYVAIDGIGVYSHEAGDGNGSLDLQAYIAGYPDAALAVGTWMQGNPPDYTNLDNELANEIRAWDNGDPKGTLMNSVDGLLKELKSTNRPVFLRWGYEVDGPWNHYEPVDFIETWRYVYNWINDPQNPDEGADNIVMVWQIAAYCDSPNDRVQNPDRNTHGQNSYDAWWPGDAYVDWTAFSYFLQQRNCLTADDNIGGLPNGFGELSDTDGQGKSEALDNVMSYLISKGKPVMIAESTPRFYDIGLGHYQDSFDVSTTNHLETNVSGQRIWDEWFDPYFDFITEYKDDIRAVAYINSQWNKYDGWGCTPGQPQGWTNCRQNYWGDSRVEEDPTILTNWYNETNGPGTIFHAYDNSFDFNNLSDWNLVTTVPVQSRAYTSQHVPRSLIGRIEAEHFDVGGNGIAYHDTQTEPPGYWYTDECAPNGRLNERVTLSSHGQGECHVSGLADEWLHYSVNVPDGPTQTYDINLRLARNYDGTPSNVLLYIDDMVTPVQTISLPDTGGWTNFTDLSIGNISVSPGNHLIRVEFEKNRKLRLYGLYPLRSYCI